MIQWLEKKIFCFSSLYLFRFLKAFFHFFFSFSCTVDLHLAQSFTSNCHSSTLIFKLFRSRLHTTLKRNLDDLGCVCQQPTRHTTWAYVKMLNLLLYHILAVNRAKVPKALPMQLFISVSNDLFDETFEQKYSFLPFRTNSKG